MALSLAEKVVAMLDGLTTSQIAALRPAARQRLADALRRVLNEIGRIDAAQAAPKREGHR